MLIGALAGCAAHATDGGGSQAAAELGAEPTAAGIAPGSLEEEGVLLLVNDRNVAFDTLVQRAGLEASVASAIVGYRANDDGSPRWFSTVDEIDALPATDDVVFRKLVGDARANGYVEAPGFDPPTAARLSIPDGLGRPPTAHDVTVEAGFDGTSPAEAIALARAHLTNAVHPQMEIFTVQTLRDTHKAFTLAVGNLFAMGSPHAEFAVSLGADSLTMLGTMSALHPTILVAEKGGQKTYFARGESGRYEPLDPPRYPVPMRARVRLASAGDPGVRVFYPPWSAKVLAQPPLGSVTERDTE